MEVIFGIRKPQSGSVLIEGRPVTIRSAIDAIRADLGFVTEDRKETGLVLCRDITDNANYVTWLKNPGPVQGQEGDGGRTQGGSSSGCGSAAAAPPRT